MLEWNVYISDWNNKEIRPHNVFRHGGFLEDCKKAARKYAKDREAFEKEIRNSMMYWYWSKCEWEIILSHWPSRPSAPDLRVDVSDQVLLNWEPFINYVWDHAVELRRREKKGEKN